MSRNATKITGFFLWLSVVCGTAVGAQNVDVLNLRPHGDEGVQHDGALSDTQEPITFEFSAAGATTDPTGLFTDEEVNEGGSNVQPPIWYSTFPVDGGVVTLAILVDRWCGARECPFRFRLEVDGSSMVLRSHVGRNYGMICQNTDAMTVDPIDLTLTACGTVIDLKAAR